MKKLISFLLCLMMTLPCMAMAEDTDLTALWEQLAAYKDDLKNQRAALDADIEALNGDIAYIELVLESAKAQLSVVQEQKKALEAKIVSAEEMLNTSATAELAEKVKAMLPPPSLTGKHYIQIDIADYGTITAELDADAAPITVTNFIKLVNEGFYDGLTFHRIIDGFMIQGGCPLGNGTGNSGENIKGEFAQNGWDNPIAHERGVLSMARSSAPDSASCQFFIMHEVSPWLDGAYAAFGHVLTGMEVVDAICANTPVTDGNGTVEKANQPVITAIKVIEKPEMTE